MKLKKIIPVIFYAFAALFLGYALWTAVHSSGIISDAIQAGQISVSRNLYDIVSFYMANSGQYFVFALLLAGTGLLLYQKRVVEQPAPTSAEKHSALEEQDDEFDAWLQENEEDEA